MCGGGGAGLGGASVREVSVLIFACGLGCRSSLSTAPCQLWVYPTRWILCARALHRGGPAANDASPARKAGSLVQQRAPTQSAKSLPASEKAARRNGTSTGQGPPLGAPSSGSSTPAGHLTHAHLWPGAESPSLLRPAHDQTRPSPGLPSPTSTLASPSSLSRHVTLRHDSILKHSATRHDHSPRRQQFSSEPPSLVLPVAVAAPATRQKPRRATIFSFLLPSRQQPPPPSSDRRPTSQSPRPAVLILRSRPDPISTHRLPFPASSSSPLPSSTPASCRRRTPSSRALARTDEAASLTLRAPHIRLPRWHRSPLDGLHEPEAPASPNPNIIPPPRVSRVVASETPAPSTSQPRQSPPRQPHSPLSRSTTSKTPS